MDVAVIGGGNAGFETALQLRIREVRYTHPSTSGI